MRRHVAGMPIDFPENTKGNLMTMTEPISHAKTGKNYENTGGKNDRRNRRKSKEAPR